MLLRQPLLAILRNLKARLRLRFVDLRRRASVARRFLRAFGVLHLLAYAGDGCVALGERLGDRAPLVVETSRLLDQLVAPRRQTFGERVRLLKFALGTLAPACQLALMLTHAAGLDLHRLERCGQLDQ